MSHTSSKRWSYIENEASIFSAATLSALNSAHEAYEQFQEIYIYAGSLVGAAADGDQALADMLFQDENGVPGAFVGGTATAEQVGRVTDARLAMQAQNNLWRAANNEIPLAQEDRLTPIRRMI